MDRGFRGLIPREARGGFQVTTFTSDGWIHPPSLKKMANKKSIEKAKEAQRTKKSLMLNPRDSFLSAKQLLHILQKTPDKYTYTREGRKGQRWDYVTGVYMKKVLNYVFGWMWDFQILEERVEYKQVIIKGRLTIKNKKGEVLIIKEQFGRADIKLLKGTKTPMDIGNDFKAAATDALKKCASELGIASDIYGKEEFQEVKAESVEVAGKKVGELATRKELDQIEKYCRDLGWDGAEYINTFIQRKIKVKLNDVITKGQAGNVIALLLRKITNHDKKS